MPQSRSKKSLIPEAAPGPSPSPTPTPSPTPETRGFFDPIQQRPPGSGNKNTDKLLKELEKIERAR